MENQDKKRELIIEAAMKRFAHFGWNKTTMNEIASDISFSKALLYYYFPDKLSLFAAVMDHIIKRISTEMQEGLKHKNSGYEAVLFYLEKRQEFVKKHFNLLESAVSSGTELPPALEEIFKNAKDAEVETIAGIITKGIESGEFNTENPKFTAEILVDALSGMRLNHFAPLRSFYPDQTQFEQILKKEKQLAVIFINGLKNS